MFLSREIKLNQSGAFFFRHPVYFMYILDSYWDYLRYISDISDVFEISNMGDPNNNNLEHNELLYTVL